MEHPEVDCMTGRHGGYFHAEKLGHLAKQKFLHSSAGSRAAVLAPSPELRSATKIKQGRAPVPQGSEHSIW
jgi:hypothetical protein